MTALGGPAEGRIGLSSYSFFWQRSGRVGAPLGLDQMVERTAASGIGVFQICDDPSVESLGDEELAALRRRSRELGVRLELGTRGIREAHLERYLGLARALDVAIVRTMLHSGDDRPDAAESVALLRAASADYERAGVALALETYEQVPTADLVGIVDRVDSPAVGICLDPANCVAALENPRDVIERCAERVVNLHVKDFRFGRNPGWVGFVLTGSPLGEGLLDLDLLLERVRPRERGISQIIEHWLPWQDTEAVTVATERDWTARNIDHLRRKGMT
jgi:sugar phosphate isomerase/epimerase